MILFVESRPHSLPSVHSNHQSSHISYFGTARISFSLAKPSKVYPMGHSTNSRMTYQYITAGNHMRFLTLALVLVMIWFFTTIPSLKDHRSGVGWRGKGDGSLELLPLAEARVYCAARRWEPVSPKTRTQFLCTP